MGIWQMFERFKPSGYAAGLALVLPLTMALNVLRLTITATLAYYFSKDVALAWHTNLEFVLVPLGVFIIWLVGKNFRASN
jgi:exosortase/archaeosortase family protein